MRTFNIRTIKSFEKSLKKLLKKSHITKSDFAEALVVLESQAGNIHHPRIRKIFGRGKTEAQFRIRVRGIRVSYDINDRRSY